MTEEEKSRSVEAAKRRGILAFCIGCVGTAIGFMVNYQSFLKSGHLLFKRVTYGGECDLERGFGLQIFRVYPMTSDPNVTSEARLSINVMSLLFAIAAITLIAFLILGMIAKARSAGKGDATENTEGVTAGQTGEKTEEKAEEKASAHIPETPEEATGQITETADETVVGEIPKKDKTAEGAEGKDGEE